MPFQMDGRRRVWRTRASGQSVLVYKHFKGVLDLLAAIAAGLLRYLRCQGQADGYVEE
jgi:hypothetical protein